MSAIIVSDVSNSVELSPDLFWSDEFNWLPVEQTVERTITGALVAQAGERVGGRPITLEPEAEDSAWMPRSVVEQLRNWAALPGMQLTLTLRNETRTVAFRHQDGPGIEARPVVHFADIGAEDFYLVTLRFMEI